jgi:hypothetical protein
MVELKIQFSIFSSARIWIFVVQVLVVSSINANEIVNFTAIFQWPGTDKDGDIGAGIALNFSIIGDHAMRHGF